MKIYLFLAGLIWLSACNQDLPRACTQIGCQDGFSVQFQKTTPWTPGTYVVTMDANQKQETCTAVLPFKDCNTPAICTSTDFVLGQSGCALPQSEHSLFGISSPRVDLSELKIEVAKDKSSLGSQSFHPTYVVSQPNGPDCGPTCKSDSAILSLK